VNAELVMKAGPVRKSLGVRPCRQRFRQVLGTASSGVPLHPADNPAIDRNHRPAPLTASTFTLLEARPFWPTGLSLVPTPQIKEYVARNTGVRPWDRDAIEQRIVPAAQNGQRKIIDSEQNLAVYPQRATTAPTTCTSQ